MTMTAPTFDLTRLTATRQMVQAMLPMDLGPLGTAPLRLYETLPSTNEQAWTALAAGDRAGTAILALRQTAGRGQRGRRWASPPGGLYLSVILRPPNLTAPQVPQLTLATAWGIATALRRLPGQLSGAPIVLPIRLKWPNDLVAQGRKLGGILTETRWQGDRLLGAIVGIGLNWVNPVPAVGITLQSLVADYPIPLIESLELLAALAWQGALWGYHRWQQDGMATLLPDYYNLLTHRDRPIPINGEMGTIIGVTATGDLRLQLPPRASGTSVPSATEVVCPPGTISLGYDE